jgi:hypothetical protein
LQGQEVDDGSRRPAQAHTLRRDTMGRLMRIGCAIMASRIWSSVSEDRRDPARRMAFPFPGRMSRTETSVRRMSCFNSSRVGGSSDTR